MQGGVVGAENTAGLESLGTVAYEPLWWFRRRENQGVGAGGLRGRKIAIGPQGSGTRALSLELIKRTGMERQVGELLALGPNEAADKLKAGEIDVPLIMTSWDAPVVQQLLADDRVALSGFPHADAAKRRASTGPAVPARLFSILDGSAARQAHYPAHSDPGRALPDDAFCRLSMTGRCDRKFCACTES